MFQISEAANLAIHVMTLLAARSAAEPIANARLAEQLQASGAHLSKVLQRLSKVGLVRSIRGAAGGFVIAREPRDVSLLEIYEAIDGALTDGSCLLKHAECLRERCVFGGLALSVRRDVHRHLSGTSLGDLVE